MCASIAFPRSFPSLCVAALCGLFLAGCGGGGQQANIDYSAFSADQTSRIPPIRPSKSAFTTTQPHHFPIHGVDVSKYQGDIDWEMARAGGTKFAYIKATEGADHVDSKFQQNWEGAKAAGVARGAYHFVFWCRTPAQEMANFKRVVPVERDALPPVLDVEATPTSQSCKRHLERGAALREMRAMLQEMERHYGKKPVIYSTVDFYEAILSNNELSEYPIWVRSTKHSPHVRYGDRKWSFWQYQSDGKVPGIRGNVDRNAFAGSPQQFLAFAGGAAGASQQMAYQVGSPARLPQLAPPGLKAIPGAVAPPTMAGLSAPAYTRTQSAPTPANKALAGRAPVNDDDD